MTDPPALLTETQSRETRTDLNALLGYLRREEREDDAYYVEQTLGLLNSLRDQSEANERG